jgi:hypothetical protein
MNKPRVEYELGRLPHEDSAHVIDSKGEIVKTYKRRHYGKEYKNMANDHLRVMSEESLEEINESLRKRFVSRALSRGETLDEDVEVQQTVEESSEVVETEEDAPSAGVLALEDLLAEMKRGRGRPKKKRDMMGNVVDDASSEYK